VSEFAQDTPRLPAGERLLWQGRPAWWPLARQAFHVRGVAIYFALFMAWRFASVLYDGGPATSAALAALWLLLPAAASIGCLLGLAAVYARTTRYSITTGRVLMQFGVALPMTLNVPFRVVGAAGLKVHRDGTGDIPLALTGKERAAYLLLWPHVRPWRARLAEPMLRAVPGAARVADTLAAALVAASEGPRPPVAAAQQVPAASQSITSAAA
jgi:hypothetical protein